MRIAIHYALFVCLLILSGCGSGDRYSDDDAQVDAAADAAADAQAEAYAEHGADSDGTNADASNVDASDVEEPAYYGCTSDCSGHEAGFQWAQDHDVTDASECGGDSQSFTEGCQAFAEARQEQADDEVQEAGRAAAEEAEDERSTEEAE